MFRPFQHLTKKALYQLYLDNQSSNCIPVSDHYTYPNADENYKPIGIRNSVWTEVEYHRKAKW